MRISVLRDQNPSFELHPFVCYQVAEAMKRMHERQNIGKVILLPEPKKSEEQPKSSAEAAESVEKNEAAVSKKKDEAVEEVKAEKDWEFIQIMLSTLGSNWVNRRVKRSKMP